MEQIQINSVKQFKILPFDLFDGDGNRLFNAGEVITPGKLMQILQYSELYIKSDNDDESPEPFVSNIESLNPLQSPVILNNEEEDEYEDDDDEYEDDDEDEDEDDDEYEDDSTNGNIVYDKAIYYKEPMKTDYSNEIYDDVIEDEEEEENVKPQYLNEEVVEDKLIQSHLFLDNDLDLANQLKGIKINHKSVIAGKIQKTVKEACEQIVETFILRDATAENTDIFLDARDTIVDEVMPVLKNVVYRSELKIFGDYEKTHGLNTAILSIALASKLGHSDYEIREIALAALLHDIGKTRIAPDMMKKSVITPKEAKIIQTHSQIGYKIITRELNLPKNIALVALEHHEKNDGSGYPYRLSIEQVSYYSQLISVCNTYDNLVSHKGHVRVESPKEAIKVMLETGSRWFNVEILYKFVHMANYNDNTPL